MPTLQPLAALFQHAVSEQVGITLTFQYRYKQHRADHAAIGAFPACQGFNPHHLAVAELHLRLEPRHDLALLQCSYQIRHAEVGFAFVLGFADMVVKPCQ